jgi:hypothetical protein
MNNWQMHELVKAANTHTFEAAKKEREQCM